MLKGLIHSKRAWEKVRNFWKGKPWKRQQEVSGTVKNINAVNASVFFLLAINNMVTGIYLNKSVPYFLLLVGLFIFLSILSLRFGTFKLNAIIFIILGVLTTLTGVEDNATGAIFLMYSFYIFHTQKSNIIIMCLTLIAIVCKFMFLEFTISQAVNMILAYVYIFLIYYILIHPKPEKSRLIFCPELDYETIQIIQYLADGLIYKEIAPLIEMTETSIRKRITRAREVMQVKSTPELVIKCHKLDYIRYKLDKIPL